MAVDQYNCDEEISGVPMPHLSFIIRYLLQPCYITENTDIPSYESLVDHNKANVVFLGSGADHLSGVLKNYNDNTETTEAFPLPVVVGITNTVLVFDESYQGSGSMNFRLDTKDCHPGYTRLIPIHPPTWEKTGLRWSENGVPWLKHISMGWQLDKMVRAASGFQCDSLPAESMEWITRERNSSWPPPSLMQSAIQNSCIVVSTAHPKSPLKDVEWQFVFHDAEQCLITSLSTSQRYCFRVFKVLVDTYTKKLATKLKTVHLKSVMFYACEKISALTWAENCGGCIMYLISKLQCHVSEKCLMNYFICGNNMVDHYSDESLEALLQCLCDIRTFPIPTVVFLAESHGIHQTHMLQPVIDNIPTFKHDKDLEKTRKEAFVPSIILLAKSYLMCNRKNVVGNMFQLAFEESRLSSMNNSSQMHRPSFKEFVLDVLCKEKFTTRSDFAKILDEQFNLNLKASIQQYHDVVTVRDIVEPNYAGPVADVPIDKGILHCSLSQMKTLDDLAYHLYQAGKFVDAATILRYGIAKVKKAKSEIIDVSDIDDPQTKANVQRQNAVKIEKVEKQQHIMYFHLRICGFTA